jgi:predicted outer membrane repeat protein
MTAMKRRALRLAVVCGLLGTASSVFALDGVVGPGNCDEAGLTEVLGSVDASGGGTITFDCGAATIVFSGSKTIDHAVLIDGGGTITFDGGGASSLLRISDTGDVTLRGLTLTRSPGAIYSTGLLTLSDDAVTENSGAFSAVTSHAALHVLRSVFSGNASSVGSGGAIQSSGGPLLIEDSTFDSNTAHDAGAVFIDSQSFDARIERSVFTSNGAGNAGAIGTSAAATLVRGSRFENNHADFQNGGAIWAAGGILTVEDSSFVGNATTSSFSGGGAIDCVTATLRVSGSTFSGNQSGQSGGGAIRTACALEIVNVTMTGNSTQGAGGAIYSSASIEGAIAFATIDANSAALGAGLFNGGSAPATLHVSRSIVSANGDSNCGGSMLVSDGYNLSDDDACEIAFTGPGDVLDANLPLQPLGDYGGPTATQPPAEGNPAIDHVPASVCAPFVDQRDGTRPFGAGCDAGAVEAGSAPGDAIFRDGFDG